MHRFYALISAALLTAFIAMIALKIDSEIIEKEIENIEQADLEDFQDSENEEVQFQLKHFNHLSKETSLLSQDLALLVSYHFSIISTAQEVSSRPPKA